MLSVVDVFETVQGEGMMTGWPAVFVRFSACNMWSGRKSGRTDAPGVCGEFCDTDFVTGKKKLTAEELANEVQRLSNRWQHRCVIVLTGGEPMLQLATEHGAEFIGMISGMATGGVWIETNGTIQIPWHVAEVFASKTNITVSPKALAAHPGSLDNIKIRSGNELKLLWPNSYDIDDVAVLCKGFHSVSVQIVDGSGKTALEAIEYIRKLSKRAKLPVRLSVQTHKHLGIK